MNLQQYKSKNHNNTFSIIQEQKTEKWSFNNNNKKKKLEKWMLSNTQVINNTNECSIVQN